jgi:hypothetical protein
VLIIPSAFLFFGTISIFLDSTICIVWIFKKIEFCAYLACEALGSIPSNETYFVSPFLQKKIVSSRKILIEILPLTL